MKQWQRYTLRVLFIIAGLLLVAFAGLIIYVRFYFFNNPFNDLRFDRNVWAAYKDSSDPNNPRGQMYEDMTKKVLKKGMSKEEVVTLLGEPDFSKEKLIFKYNIGAWSGFRIDYDTLDIHFDPQGQVTDFTRAQH